MGIEFDKVGVIRFGTTSYAGSNGAILGRAFSKSYAWLVTHIQAVCTVDATSKSLALLVKKNGTTIKTLTIPATANAGDMYEARIDDDDVYCAAGDLITVVLSNADPDAALAIEWELSGTDRSQ